MGLIRILIGFYIGWMALKAMRRFVDTALAKRQTADGTLDKERPPTKTLELMPCPTCGIYTTAPCTNPDCLQSQ